MKKIIKHHLDAFREKDLKRYSKVINQYFKRKFRFIFLLVFASCALQNQINKDEYKKFPKQMNVKFYDKLDSIFTQYDNRLVTRSFIKDFSDKENIDYSKPVELTISKDVMFLKFEDTLKRQYVLKFYGKLHKKKFIFYTNYETISFPILFMTKQMTKYAVYWPNDNEIIFEEQNRSAGMLLFFGDSRSSQFNYKFKILKDE